MTYCHTLLGAARSIPALFRAADVSATNLPSPPRTQRRIPPQWSIGTRIVGVGYSMRLRLR
jgi:hypothetical protein